MFRILAGLLGASDDLRDVEKIRKRAGGRYLSREELKEIERLEESADEQIKDAYKNRWGLG